MSITVGTGNDCLARLRCMTGYGVKKIWLNVHFDDKKNETESIAALNRVTKMEPEVAKQTYDFYYGIVTREGVPSERALIDDFELARLMLPKAEIQNVTRQQAEQKLYDFRFLKEITKG
ncbi:MAG TPA: hypothetical protein VLJ79_25985 [Candidatus Binatia bacterium]|nr:hypothetical protein [Candidatus Binatia bacterium]